VITPPSYKVAIVGPLALAAIIQFTGCSAQAPVAKQSAAAASGTRFVPTVGQPVYYQPQVSQPPTDWGHPFNTPWDHINDQQQQQWAQVEAERKAQQYRSQMQGQYEQLQSQLNNLDYDLHPYGW
jgi:hypothetical protein